MSGCAPIDSTAYSASAVTVGTRSRAVASLRWAALERTLSTFMRSRHARTLRAFALAPLVAPASLAATLLGTSVIQGFGRAPWPAVRATADLVLVVAALGIPIAYGAALIGGVPAYLLLRRFDAVRRTPLVCVGGGIGVVVALVLAPYLRGDPLSIPSPWWVGLGLGLVTGEAFWRLVRDRAAPA